MNAFTEQQQQQQQPPPQEIDKTKGRSSKLFFCLGKSFFLSFTEY
jgi:hypothetical protein